MLVRRYHTCVHTYVHDSISCTQPMDLDTEIVIQMFRQPLRLPSSLKKWHIQAHMYSKNSIGKSDDDAVM